MLDRIHTFYAWLHTHQGRKLFRYTMVSVISTLVSLTVIALVYGVFHWWTEVPSTIFGNFVATFPSYWLNRRWAWGKGGRSHWLKEVAPFWFMSALGIAFSIIGASLARHFSITHNFGNLEKTATVEFANVISFAVFWALKLMVFNKMFKVELEEFDEHLTAEEAVEESAIH